MRLYSFIVKSFAVLEVCLRLRKMRSFGVEIYAILNVFQISTRAHTHKN